MVRNPWDRMISYYSWLREQSFDHIAVFAAKQNDFSGFIKIQNVATSIKASPYAGYVTDRHGQEVCQSFIRLEHLDNDIAKLETALDFKIGPLPIANPSKRVKNYRDSYSEEDRDWIGEICARDIARFGYEF